MVTVADWQNNEFFLVLLNNLRLLGLYESATCVVNGYRSLTWFLFQCFPSFSSKFKFLNEELQLVSERKQVQQQKNQKKGERGETGKGNILVTSI